MIEKTINGIHDQNVAKPHVVLIPYPSQGHINPILQFGKRLASKGIKATLATPKHILSSFSSLENVAFEPISDGFENRGSLEVGSEDLFLSAFKSNGSISLSGIIETHQNSAFPVTCVVYDAFLPWALDVAKEYGLLGAAFFTNSAAVCSIFCCVSHDLIELPLNPDKVKSVLPKMPLFKGNDFPTFLRKPETYPAYLTMKLSQFSNLHLADWMFCNSFDDLETKVIEGVQDKWPAKMIGPMVPSSYLDGRIEGDIGYGSSLWKSSSEKCKEWLKTKPKESVIYVSFGSMVSLTQQQTEEIALALKQSNYNFLWVVRETQMSKLPKGFEQELCMTKKGLIVTWCNQLEILGHEAVACFLTHCGWNSTLEGLSLGIPMVGVPQWSDQLPDAKFIEEVWEVGVWAKEDDKGVVRKEILGECLKEVMEGEKGIKIRENAIKWRKLSKKAVDNGGSSDKHIEDFVQYLRCNCFAKTKSNGFH